ncbi:hypothetical protein [Halorientalis salina]|uniref:hypothetical protein n=1 Tax=Halorientalis salina TaxID=2932266 RepID=UPI0010ABB47D|nr:hypothetical protein [Halorientalis salina]
MSLQIDDALREGFQRTFARSGLLLVAVFVAFGFANAVISQSLSQQLFEWMTSFDQPIPQEGAPFGPRMDQETPFALPIPLPALALLSLLTVLIAEAIHIVAIRVFASENTESIPDGAATRRIGLATINGVVGGIVAGVLTVLGLILLIVPGIYVAISLFFVRQEIAVADKNFVDALADSWSLTDGDRWELLGLAIIVIVINLVASSPTTVLFFLDQAIGTAVSLVVSGLTTVFGIAVATRAYEQLRREREADLGLDGENGSDDVAGTDTGWNTGNNGV